MSDDGVKTASARSPMAGCAILIAALLVMVFLVVFSTITLFRQFDEIVKFTAEKPQVVEVDALLDRDDEVVELVSRLEQFRIDLDGEDEARLELDAGDLNLAIAVFDHLKELRGTLRVRSIEEGMMKIDISFPLNGKPRLADEDEGGLVASDNRYLNAVMVAKPRLMKHEVVLKLDDIQVEGAEVPDEFIQQMSPYRVMERYQIDPVLGPVMAQLTRVEVADGKVVLLSVPGESAVGELTDEEVGDASSRFLKVLGIAACLFLAFAGTMVIMGMRKKSADQEG